MSAYDCLSLVCALALVCQGRKRVYKALGLSLVVCSLWGVAVTPSLNKARSKARALVSSASAPDTWTTDEIQSLVIAESDLIGLDPAFALTVSEIESGHRNVTGDQGRSHGPMQVQAQYHIPEGDPTDPRISVRAGVKVLADKLDRYDGDMVKARLAYVCGTPSGCSTGKARKVISKLERVAPQYGLNLTSSPVLDPWAL